MMSSAILTAFSDFPPPLSTPSTTMWTCSECAQYLNKYINHFNLRPHINLNRSVTSVKRNNDGTYTVNTKNNVDEVFSHVAVTTGLNQTPNIPAWVPSTPHTKFTHSSNISNFANFKNKNVVVIRLGESGSDISLTIASIAKSLRISTRKPNSSGYVVPRYTNGVLTDLNTNRVRHGIWNPSDYLRFANTLRETLNCPPPPNPGTLSALTKIWNGTENLSQIDIETIFWNSDNKAHSYDRFGTKND